VPSTKEFKSLKAASVKHRVTGASVVATAVPTTSDPPVAPSFVIIRRRIGISGFNRRTIGALGFLYRVGYYVPSHCGSYKHSRKDCGRANQSEIRHAYLLLVLVARIIKRRRERGFQPRLLKDNSLSPVPEKQKLLRRPEPKMSVHY
jgi:hypothetical protein